MLPFRAHLGQGPAETGAPKGTQQREQTGRKDNPKEVQRELEAQDVFFWQRGEEEVAKPLSSSTIHWPRTDQVILFRVGERSRLNEIRWKLRTIHPNPGPRDQTEEGRRARIERKKQRRADKRAERTRNREEQLRQKKEKEEKHVNVVTWNVQRLSVGTMNKRRLKAVAEYAGKNKWEVVLLTEVRATGRGTVWLGEGDNLTAVTYSEKAAVMLTGRMLRKWCEEGQRTKADSRTVSVKIMGFTFISTYLPVWTGNNEEEIEAAKEVLTNHRKWNGRGETCIIGGDFNAHIGGGEDRPGVCGKFGIRQTNHQGAALLDWCENNNMCYVNSFYNHTKRGTWFNQALARWYELDGFMMENSDRHRFIRKICTVGESTLSDHKPKKVKIQLVSKFAFRRRKPKKIPRIRWERLKNDDIARSYREKVEELLQELEGDDPENGPLENTNWESIAEVVNKAAEEVCGIEERKIENPWMAEREEEIQVMRARINGAITRRNTGMERLRENQDENAREDLERELEEAKEELKTARKDLKKKSRDWENEWWENIIVECREAGERGDSGTVYRTLRDLGKRGMTKATDTTNLTTAQFKDHFSSISKDRFENPPHEIEEIVNQVKDISETEVAKRWSEELENEPEREEILQQMSKMKNSAPGRDGVRLIYLLKAGPRILGKLIQMIKFMFSNGADKWEEALKIGLVIPLFKKGCKNNTNNYRGVCLLAMGSRILARILADRIRIWAEKVELLDDEQAGFRSKRSTADITQMMYRIQEDARDLYKRAEAKGEEIEEGDKPTARLLDLRKAYPRVNKPALWGILKRYGMGEKCLRAVHDLHETTQYRIKSREGESEAWVPERGLREGCPTSPPLFNIYHQAVMRLASKARKRKAEETGLDAGLNFKWVPGSSFPNMRRWEKENSEAKRRKIDQGLFADDTTIIGRKREIDQGVDEIKKVMNMFEERNNEDKEETLDFGTEEGGKIRVLGCYLGEGEDIRQRLKRAGYTWMKVRRQLKGAKVSKRVQARVVEACVESTLLFDCQARTWQLREVKQLQQSMDRKYRHIWSNKREPPLIQMQREGKNMYDVRRELGVRSVRQKIEKRVLERIGHVMRMEDTRLVKASVLGWWEELESWEKVPGKKRKTVLYYKNVLKEAAIDWTKVGALSKDRDGWKALVRERVRHVQEWEHKSGHGVPGERGERTSPTPEQQGDGFPCEWEGCDKICRSRAGLTTHVKRMHEESSEKVEFVCQECRESFKQNANLINHKKICSGMVSSDPSRLRKCRTCLGEFSKRYFSTHRKSCGNGAGPTTPPPQPTQYQPHQYLCQYCHRWLAKTNRSRHEKVCQRGEGVL